jgi:hypothetical protein
MANEPSRNAVKVTKNENKNQQGQATITDCSPQHNPVTPLMLLMHPTFSTFFAVFCLPSTDLCFYDIQITTRKLRDKL